MEEQTSEEEQARVAALERMIAEEARTRVGDAGDEVPETDDYADNWHFQDTTAGETDIEYEGEGDEFDQDHMTHYFQTKYEEAGGIIPIPTIVSNHFEKLRDLGSDDIIRLKDEGTYLEIMKLVGKLDKWVTLSNPESGLYRRIQGEIFTDKTLQLLEDAMSPEEPIDEGPARPPSPPPPPEKTQKLIAPKHATGPSREADKMFESSLHDIRSLGDKMHERFRFIFEEVGWLEQKYFRGREKDYADLHDIYWFYNTPLPRGPAAFGKFVRPKVAGIPHVAGMPLYNWITELGQTDQAIYSRKLRGDRDQFKEMYTQLVTFEKKWKKTSKQLGINWEAIRRQGIQGHAQLASKKGLAIQAAEKYSEFDDPPFEQTREGRAAVSKEIKNNSDFQKALVDFMWSENTAKALNSRESGATETMLHEFFTMWKGFFPDLKVVPGDWPKQSIKGFRQKKSITYVDNYLFFGKLRDLAKSTVTSQKDLAEGDASKVYTRLGRKDAFLWFVKNIQDRQKYLEWAGVAGVKPPQEPPVKPPERARTPPPKPPVRPPERARTPPVKPPERARTPPVKPDSLLTQLRQALHEKIKYLEQMKDDKPGMEIRGQVMTAEFLKDNRDHAQEVITRIQERIHAAEGQEEKPPEEQEEKPPWKELDDHVHEEAPIWFEEGETDLRKLGQAGITIDRIDKVVDRAKDYVQQLYPHYKIVQEVSKFLGFNNPTNGQMLLRQFLEDTGTGKQEPQHPWSWEQVKHRYGSGADDMAHEFTKEWQATFVMMVVRELGKRLHPGTFPGTVAEGRVVDSFTTAERALYDMGHAGPKTRQMLDSRGDEKQSELDAAEKARGDEKQSELDAAALARQAQEDVIRAHEQEQDELARARAVQDEQEQDELARARAVQEGVIRAQDRLARKEEAKRLEEENKRATAVRLKGLHHSSKIEEELKAIRQLTKKINHPEDGREISNHDAYVKLRQKHQTLIRQLQDESARPAETPRTFDVIEGSPPPRLPMSLSPSPEPETDPETDADLDLSLVQYRPRRPPRRSLSPPQQPESVETSPEPSDRERSLSLPEFQLQPPSVETSPEPSSPSPRIHGDLSQIMPRPRQRPRRSLSPDARPYRRLGAIRRRPVSAPRPSHVGQVSFQLGGVQRIPISGARQRMPPPRRRPRPPPQIPPANMQRAAPAQAFGAGHARHQAQQDIADRNAALVALRQHPRFIPDFERNFEYDPHTRTYKEKRRTYYSYHPTPTAIVGSYQLQGVHHEEVAYVQARHPDIETFKRKDAYDTARKFNREAKKRPIDGRARQYLTVGPWMRLRLLKTSVHITQRGTPPQKAYYILAKHILKQIQHAVKPRIVSPNLKGTKKQFITIADTENLENITQSRLAALLEKGLRRKTKHIIYRQTNSGGPLMEYAKKNDALY